MFDFLQKFSFIESVILLVIIGGTIITAIILLVKGGFSLRKGNSEIKMGKTDAKIPVCDLDYNIANLVSKTTDIVARISEIKVKGTLGAQMSVCEQKLLVARSILQSNYKKILTEKGDDNPTAHGDYLYYTAIIKLAIQESTSNIKHAFIYNRLAEFTEQDFNSYIDGKIEMIILGVEDYVDMMYVSEDRIINREEIKKKFIETESDYTDTYRQIFYDARSIAIEKSKLISEMESELSDFHDSTIQTLKNRCYFYKNMNNKKEKLKDEEA